MQLPGLGRMMNFHVGPHTDEEGSRLDIYLHEYVHAAAFC